MIGLAIFWWVFSGVINLFGSSISAAFRAVKGQGSFWE